MKNPLLVIASLILLYCADTNAQGGLLDTSFGVEGILANEIYPYSVAKIGILATSDHVYAVLQGINESPFSTYIRGYNPDGTVDGSFGTNGTLTIEAFGGTAALLNNEHTKIYICGRNLSEEPGIMEVDISNGTYLMHTYPNETGYSDIMYYMTITDNNEVFIGGYHINTLVNSGALRVVKFNQDLNVDSSFGTDGLVTFPEVEGLNGSGYYLLDLEADHLGNVFLLGKLDDTHKIFKLSSSGSIDTSFTEPNELSPYTYFSDLTISPDNQLLVCPATTYTQYILRLNNDGSIDNSFASAGVFQIDSPISDYLMYWRRLLVEPDGSLVAIGSYQSFTTNSYVGKCLLKLDPSGAVATGFELIFNDFNYQCGYNFALNDNIVAVQPDGKILSIDFGVCYDTESTVHFDNVISRYNTEITSSIDENKEADFIVFPNPASGIVNLQWRESTIERPSQVIIIDACGNIVWKSKPNESNKGIIEVNTSLFPAGLYSIASFGKYENQSMRFVVEK
jgi:uncharacterized delta-60 repeat protein